jgi:biotin operon repressor
MPFVPKRKHQAYCCEDHRYQARGRIVRMDQTDPDINLKPAPIESGPASWILTALVGQHEYQWMSRADLSLLTNVGDRQMRMAIEELRQHGYPVLNRTKAPGGYRLAVSVEDAAPLLGGYHRRAMTLLYTYSRLRVHMASRLHPRQMLLVEAERAE